MKPKAALTPPSMLRNSDLSSGARIIFPYLTYFSRKKGDNGNREISADTIYKYLGVPPITVMMWLFDLERQRYIKDPYFEESPDKDRSVYKFQFAHKIENEIDLN